MSELGTLLLDGDRVVSVLVSEVFHRRRQMAEENCTKPLGRYSARKREESKQLTDVLLSDLLTNLNIRTINSSNQ